MARGAKLLTGDPREPAQCPFPGRVPHGPPARFPSQGGKGSHRVFNRRGEPLQLNFQDRDGNVPPHARQLVRMIE